MASWLIIVDESALPVLVYGKAMLIIIRSAC
jgi:hypothetical protein